MFQKTRIKLTAWYLLIIMSISLFFTLIIYSMINAEFQRFERMQIKSNENMRLNLMMPIDPRISAQNLIIIEQARNNLINRLFLLNLGIFIFSAGAGYFLAGNTLKPIKRTMDEQKRFISDSSHELRTPLSAMRTEIEVGLLDKKLNISKSRKLLESNLEEVIELQTLTDRLLELAQNGNNINKSSFEVVNIEIIVSNAIKKVEKIAKLKNIKIKSSIQKANILAAPDRIAEAIVILLDNAIKYSPKNSNIEIKTKISKNNIYILVKDEGLGISKEDLNHIFDRFYRAEISRSEEGFGLGLSIAKRIVELHKGKIEVESELDKGSTFTVILPKA